MTTPDKQLYRLRDVQDTHFTAFVEALKDRKRDIALTLEWANDPLARKMSFSQEPISSGKHGTWFRNRVEEGNWWILEEFNGYGDVVPIGQVRFDKRVGMPGVRSNDAMAQYHPTFREYFIVSIFIDANFRGKGYAVALLRMGLYKVESQQPHLPCTAYIKSENVASLQLFRGAGFDAFYTLGGKRYVTEDGDDYITLVRHRE